MVIKCGHWPPAVVEVDKDSINTNMNKYVSNDTNKHWKRIIRKLQGRIMDKNIDRL